MPQSSRRLIAERQRNKRFMGTCPLCLQDFQLADAVFFAIGSEPPERAVIAIAAARARIKERGEALAKARERMTTRAERTAEAVNLGKIVEKIVPSFASFTYTPGDCRALFEPIDYLVFSGLTSRGQVDALFFVDVKSGNARLTQDQKSIRRAVEGERAKRFAPEGVIHVKQRNGKFRRV